MTQEKRKNDIKLLDEILYGNCFLYSKLNIAASFGVDYRYLLTNNFFFFDYDENFMFPIRPKIYSFDNDDKLFFDMGIKVEILDIENSIEAIIEALNQNKYIMQCIDCYYFPSYGKCYKKKHRYHYFVIYGYDNNKRIFYIIEPWGFTMGTPLLQTIGYNELIENIKYAKESFCLDRYTFVYSRINESRIDYNSILNKFVYNYYSIYDKILKNYSYVEMNITKLFSQAFYKCYNSQNLEKFFGYLDRFYRIKKSQAYLLNKLLSNLEINLQMNKILIFYLDSKKYFTYLYNGKDVLGSEQIDELLEKICFCLHSAIENEIILLDKLHYILEEIK